MPMTFDDDHSVAIMMVPTAMPTAIMFIEFSARPAIVAVVVVIAVAANTETKLGSAGN